MYHILTYTYCSDYLSARVAFRLSHFDYISPYINDGSLLLGGATASPENQGLLIFKGLSRESIELFALQDPYLVNGIATNYSIREWTVVAGCLFDKE